MTEYTSIEQAPNEKVPAVLDIQAYSLSYRTARGPLRVLDGIDLHIKRGQVVGLVGESGSGKSSLAYAIMRGLPGRVASEQGIICFNGQQIHSLTETELQTLRGNRIAMVFQNAAAVLNPTQTLGEHVFEVLRQHRNIGNQAARQRTLELFSQVGLADPEAMLERYAHQVSGGEKQRVVLATAFACDPDLILFDEPTSALDATTAITLLDLFRELQSTTGISALFISHDLAVIASIAHEVAVIYGGRIVEVNSTDELFRTPRHPYTRALLANITNPLQKEARSVVTLSGPGPDRLGAVPACTFSDRCPFVTVECLAESVRLRPVENPQEGLSVDVAHGASAAQVACIHWQTFLEQPLATGEEHSNALNALTGVELPVLTADSINVRFEQKRSWFNLTGSQQDAVYAVNNANFYLHKGETLGLVGGIRLW